jgi:hypothetical protein
MTEETVQDQQEITQTTPENLTITDLVMLKNIISVVSQRGAFKAEEMEDVGKTFNKLSAFLAAATASTQSSDTQEPTDE